MIKFSDRLKLVTLYRSWLCDSNVKLNERHEVHHYRITDCPESFIVFLLQNGFLNESAIKDAIKKIHETHVEIEDWEVIS